MIVMISSDEITPAADPDVAAIADVVLRVAQHDQCDIRDLLMRGVLMAWLHTDDHTRHRLWNTVDAMQKLSDVRTRTP